MFDWLAKRMKQFFMRNSSNKTTNYLCDLHDTGPTCIDCEDYGPYACVHCPYT